MGFTYTASFTDQALSTATDLFEVTVGADRPVRVLGLELTQSSDLGDASEEVLRIGFYRAVTAGSTGTAATEVALGDGDAPAATAAVTYLRGTASTGGTLLWVVGWNIRIPTPWIPIPENVARIDAAEDPFSFRLIAAPADAITVSATLAWEEA